MPTADELKQWRLWITEVFMPLTTQMEQTIIANAHLIQDEAMPQEFKDLLAHVEAYKTVLNKWNEGDYSEHNSYVPFPRDLHACVKKTYASLKLRQLKLSSRFF
jgi:hypothetical protein